MFNLRRAYANGSALWLNFVFRVKNDEFRRRSPFGMQFLCW